MSLTARFLTEEFFEMLFAARLLAVECFEMLFTARLLVSKYIEISLTVRFLADEYFEMLVTVRSFAEEYFEMLFPAFLAEEYVEMFFLAPRSPSRVTGGGPGQSAARLVPSLPPPSPSPAGLCATSSPSSPAPLPLPRHLIAPCSPPGSHEGAPCPCPCPGPFRLIHASLSLPIHPPSASMLIRDLFSLSSGNVRTLCSSSKPPSPSRVTGGGPGQSAARLVLVSPPSPTTTAMRDPLRW